MTIHVKKSEIYDIFNVSIHNNYMMMRIDANSPWDYSDLYDLLQDEVQNGVRYVLIDKRDHTTKPEEARDECPKVIGTYIAQNKLRYAAVLNDADHIEKIACYGAMRQGGHVLSTYNMEEAMLWLGGAVK